jgi:hypothetical protein
MKGIYTGEAIVARAAGLVAKCDVSGHSQGIGEPGLTPKILPVAGV